MNRATRTIISVLGICFALAGLDHGFFETLQGNALTPGLFIQAIGPVNRMWVHGTEDALTIVPNFLATGLLAMAVSLAIAAWAIGFVQRRHGPTVFLVLFVLLFLVGGGVAQVVFFVPAWLVATRINQPLTWWRRTLPEKVRLALGRLWAGSLLLGVLAFLVALEIAVFGYVPGLSAADADVALYVCWSFLLAALVLFLFTFVAGFAHDLDERLAQAA